MSYILARQIFGLRTGIHYPQVQMQIQEQQGLNSSNYSPIKTEDRSGWYSMALVESVRRWKLNMIEQQFYVAK
jgi:hypothetical protein